MDDLSNKLDQDDKIIIYKALDSIETNNRRMYKLVIILSVFIFVTAITISGAFLFYIYQYDFSVATTTTTTTTQVDQSTDGGGDANYIGRDGEITYGKADGKNNDNNDNNNNKADQERK